MLSQSSARNLAQRKAGAAGGVISVPRQVRPGIPNCSRRQFLEASHICRVAHPKRPGTKSPVTVRVTRAQANHDASSRNWDSFPINVHCRHGEASPELHRYINEEVNNLLLNKMRGGEVVEAEGGIAAVDVRLMHTQASIEVFPRQLNKQLHDTFLRQGELKALAQDPAGSGEAGMRSCFDLALQQLESKLKKNHKEAPRKVDQHRRVAPAAGARGN